MSIDCASGSESQELPLLKKLQLRIDYNIQG